jgi:hypothetical protein
VIVFSSFNFKVSGQTLTAAVVAGNATYLLPAHGLEQHGLTDSGGNQTESVGSPKQDGTVTYMVTTAINSNDGVGHATRVSPLTVQWLMDNYETAEGVSLPRSTLYKHYMRQVRKINTPTMIEQKIII